MLTSWASPRVSSITTLSFPTSRGTTPSTGVPRSLASRNLPGHWLRCGPCWQAKGGRWFAPERASRPDDPWRRGGRGHPRSRHCGRQSRTAGKRIAIALSGGRDSGSVAIAAACARCPCDGHHPDIRCRSPCPRRPSRSELCGRHGLACGLCACPVAAGSGRARRRASLERHSTHLFRVPASHRSCRCGRVRGDRACVDG